MGCIEYIHLIYQNLTLCVCLISDRLQVALRMGITTSHGTMTSSVTLSNLGLGAPNSLHISCKTAIFLLITLSLTGRAVDTVTKRYFKLNLTQLVCCNVSTFMSCCVCCTLIVCVCVYVCVFVFACVCWVGVYQIKVGVLRCGRVIDMQLVNKTAKSIKIIAWYHFKCINTEDTEFQLDGGLSTLHGISTLNVQVRQRL